MRAHAGQQQCQQNKNLRCRGFMLESVRKEPLVLLKPPAMEWLEVRGRQMGAHSQAAQKSLIQADLSACLLPLPCLAKLKRLQGSCSPCMNTLHVNTERRTGDGGTGLNGFVKCLECKSQGETSESEKTEG